MLSRVSCRTISVGELFVDKVSDSFAWGPVRRWRELVEIWNASWNVLGWTGRKARPWCLLNKANPLHFTDDIVTALLVRVIKGLLSVVAAGAWASLSSLFLGIGESCFTCIDEHLRWTLLLICSLKINVNINVSYNKMKENHQTSSSDRAKSAKSYNRYLEDFCRKALTSLALGYLKPGDCAAFHYRSLTKEILSSW